MTVLPLPLMSPLPSDWLCQNGRKEESYMPIWLLTNKFQIAKTFRLYVLFGFIYIFMYMIDGIIFDGSNSSKIAPAPLKKRFSFTSIIMVTKEKKEKEKRKTIICSKNGRYDRILDDQMEISVANVRFHANVNKIISIIFSPFERHNRQGNYNDNKANYQNRTRSHVYRLQSIATIGIDK